MAAPTKRLIRSNVNWSRAITPTESVTERNYFQTLSKWNIGIGAIMVLVLAFSAVHFTMHQLQQLDNAIKIMDQAYFQNLTMHLSQIYSQMLRGGVTAAAARTTGPRIDYAQSNHGAKIIRFTGEEVAHSLPFMDGVRHWLGLYVPKGACRILSSRTNKDKFLTFKGDCAKIIIELNQAVFLDTFKIEHYIPDSNDTGAIGMMPKNVIISGIRKSTNKPIILGQLHLEFNPESKLQIGAVHISDPKESFEWFQIDILNNHGRKDLTRMYKVRIFGEIDDMK